MDRFGKAEELIGACLFLTNTRLASFINGVLEINFPKEEKKESKKSIEIR